MFDCFALGIRFAVLVFCACIQAALKFGIAMFLLQCTTHKSSRQIKQAPRWPQPQVQQPQPQAQPQAQHRRLQRRLTPLPRHRHKVQLDAVDHLVGGLLEEGHNQTINLIAMLLDRLVLGLLNLLYEIKSPFKLFRLSSLYLALESTPAMRPVTTIFWTKGETCARLKELAQRIPSNCLATILVWQQSWPEFSACALGRI
jgi:hypothetical protein